MHATRGRQRARFAQKVSYAFDASLIYSACARHCMFNLGETTRGEVGQSSCTGCNTGIFIETVDRDLNCITEAKLSDEAFTGYGEDNVGLLVKNFTGSTLISLVTRIPGNVTVANNTKLENLYFTELKEVDGHLVIGKSNPNLKKVWFSSLANVKSFKMDKSNFFPLLSSHFEP